MYTNVTCFEITIADTLMIEDNNYFIEAIYTVVATRYTVHVAGTWSV